MTDQQRPAGYSSAQIMLHWSIATLVLFQFFFNDGIDDAWDALMDGEAIEGEAQAAANVHIIIGVTILALALWRIVLRVTRGVPPPPESEPAPLRLLAEFTHLAFYVLLVATPLAGAAAWFLASETASFVHGLARALLFVLVILHVAGALMQHFVFRSSALKRILMTQD